MKFCEFPYCTNGDTSLKAYKKCHECCIYQPKTREERIQVCMEENRLSPYAELTSTRGYCEALVDGEDEVRAKTGVEINAMYQMDRRLLAEQKIINAGHKMEQKTMTRIDALNKVSSVAGTTLADRCIVVDCLAALGLIKFDEPMSAERKAVDVLVRNGLAQNQSWSLMTSLEKAGLKIVEK